MNRVATSFLLAAFPARVLLDVLHTPSPGAARFGGGLLAVGVVICAAASLPRWRERLLGRLALLWTALVLLAALRAGFTAEALRLALLYVSAPAFGLAVASWVRPGARERLLVGASGAAAFCVGLSLLDRLAAPDLVLHDYPRWLGAYASHHAHALAMAVFVLLGLALVGEGRRAGWLLSAGAAVALASTWVRTAWLLVAVTVGVMLLLRHRLRAAAVFGSLLGVACLHPAVRDRFADVGAVFRLSAPAGGWEALGSWRGRIWLESVEAFVGHGPGAWVFGLGLGAHDDLYRSLDPHHEYLTLWFQLGLLGPLLLLAALAVALVVALRAARWEPELGAGLAGMVVAVGLLCGVSNVLLERPVVGMALWGLVGLLSSARRSRAASDGSG